MPSSKSKSSRTRSKHKKTSDQANQDTMIYGINTLESLLQHAPNRVLHVLYVPVSKGRLPKAKQNIIDLAQKHEIEVSIARDRQFEHYLPNVQHHQLEVEPSSN